jgi:uncharacterized RDD family membrane protein YckC
MKNIIFFIPILTTTGFLFAKYLNKKIPTMITPYIKADIKRRFLAVLIDLIICSILGFYVDFNKLLGLPLLIAIILFIFFKDGLFQGRSPGKVATNLMVIRLEDGKPAGLIDSFSRNFIFVIPGINIGALFFESIIVFKNKQGIRLGDKIAKTQVIIGKTSTESILDIILHNQGSPWKKREII